MIQPNNKPEYGEEKCKKEVKLRNLPYQVSVYFYNNPIQQ